jgi:peptidoglycan/LPS O-acetylase OafA/YrhL
VAGKRASGRDPGIDSLRGLSILLVVIHHMALRIPLQRTELAAFLPRRILLALGYNGYEAVFIFFVISGFLIAGNALRRWSSLGGMDRRAFYVRRFARIAPCLVVLLAVLSIFDLLRVPNFVIDPARQSLGRALLSAFGLHLNWYEGRTGYLPAGWDVLWSLSIEELFYVGFPVACLLARRGTLVLVAPLLILAFSLPVTRGILSANEIWQEKAYLPGMAAIATGVLAAIWSASSPQTSQRMSAALGWLGIACIGAVLLAEDLLWKKLGEITMLVLTFGTASLVVAFGSGWSTACLTGRAGWLRSCGRLSYEIYLSHMFVVWPAIWLFRWLGGSVQLGWLFFPPTVALAWALGWTIDRLVSTPADQWLLARLAPLTAATEPAFARS